MSRPATTRAADGRRVNNLTCECGRQIRTHHTQCAMCRRRAKQADYAIAYHGTWIRNPRGILIPTLPGGDR